MRYLEEDEMPNIKRITDLSDYKTVLPYASEIFGVYQPLIGWKSKRKIGRIKDAVRSEKNALLSQLGRNLVSTAVIEFNADCFMTAPDLRPAGLAGPRLSSHKSIVLRKIQAALRASGRVPADVNEWSNFVNEDELTRILQTDVVDYYSRLSISNCQTIAQLPQLEGESGEEFRVRKWRLILESQRDIRTAINDEAVIAGVLKMLLDKGAVAALNSIFFSNLDANGEAAFQDVLDKAAIGLRGSVPVVRTRSGTSGMSACRRSASSTSSASTSSSSTPSSARRAATSG